MKLSVLLTTLLVVALLLVTGWQRVQQVYADQAGGFDEPRIQAVTFDSNRKPAQSPMSDLQAHGITHIAVTPFGWQDHWNAPEVHFRAEARYYTEGRAGIMELAEDARAAGIRLIVKPHIWLRNGAASQFYQGEEPVEKWRDEIGFETEEEWAIWEETYSTFMLHYARLAEEVNADLLCIGTELSNVARTRPDFWRGLIREIRTVYSGRLTYAANWYREFEEITFWDELDFIGVQAYFPISEAPDPSTEDLMDGWESHFDAIEAVRREYDKPVLFTEIGYRSVPFAAAKPWQWPSRADEERDNLQPDLDIQARLYEAFFQTFWDRRWVGGAIFWKWYPDPHSRRGRHLLDFTPQEKPAAQVMAEWFKGRG